ncbi:MAG: group II truncated hemoglobin [Candidatus Sedimenticola sp. PURPLELP]
MNDIPNPYQQLGGEAGVRELVDRFYDYMDQVDEVRDIRSMHAKSLKVSREKLFMFLSGWLGGPGLYEEKYGHPRLRQRHMPFSIGQAERDQWLSCMERALGDMSIDEGLRKHLMQAFWRTADHMRNRPEHESNHPGLKIFSDKPD